MLEHVIPLNGMWAARPLQVEATELPLTHDEVPPQHAAEIHL